MWSTPFPAQMVMWHCHSYNYNTWLIIPVACARGSLLSCDHMFVRFSSSKSNLLNDFPPFDVTKNKDEKLDFGCHYLSNNNFSVVSYRSLHKGIPLCFTLKKNRNVLCINKFQNDPKRKNKNITSRKYIMKINFSMKLQI